jgi:hypothetical protein
MPYAAVVPIIENQHARWPGELCRKPSRIVGERCVERPQQLLNLIAVSHRFLPSLFRSPGPSSQVCGWRSLGDTNATRLLPSIDERIMLGLGRHCID